MRAEAYKTVWAWHAATPMVPLTRGARSRHADVRGQVVAELARRREARPGAPAVAAAVDAALLGLVRDPVAEVGHAAYAALTHEDPDQPRPGQDRARADVHLAAMASPRASVRAAGAAGARHAPAAAVRARLIELVRDDQPAVHTAAIEALDHVAPTDAEGFAAAFASIFYALQVRAGELCGTRRDRRAVAPMQRLLSIPRTDVDRPSDELRRRAARALADVGDPGAVPFQSGLLDDDDPIVREMAARGLATACGPAEQPALLDALGHADLPVRSWAAEGLARLGDLRALPVLAGTQRHDHRPLRLGAIVGLTALGADGARGLRQALEDPERDVADLAFAVIVARDVALAAAGVGPDLLLDALASPAPELRFAAARLIEARAAGAPLLDVATELVGPRRPDKAADLRDWPAEARRAALLRVVVDNLASDVSERRYAAAQVLALRPQPLAFWREAARLVGPAQTTVPATNYASEHRTARASGWIRRLVVGRAAAVAKTEPTPTELERLAIILAYAGGPEPRPVPPRPAAAGLDRAVAARLVFGVYAGLVRQGPAPGAADETQRIRRDAVERIAALAADGAVGRDAALPALEHALADSHNLVRAGAMAAVRAQYPKGALAPLAAALRSAADIGKAAIDELVGRAAAGDADAAALVHAALDADDAAVRAHALLRLPRLYPAGSVAPLLAGARSRHADVRAAAVGQLVERGSDGAAAADAAPVIEALATALGSDDAELRFGAADGLARRGDLRAIDALAAFLRDGDRTDEACTALIEAAGRAPTVAAAAATALATRLLEDPDRTADVDALIAGLGSIAHEAGAPALLDDLDERGAEDQLERLLADRDVEVRTRACEALALRVAAVPTATLGPLEAALRGGRRELVLPAGEGLARRGRPEAFFALLLVLKAGEPPERERAALALGELGDRRALEHLLPILDAGPDAPQDQALAPTVIATLGAMVHALAARPDADADELAGLRERIERTATAGLGPARRHAPTALRHIGDARSRALLEQIMLDRELGADERAAAATELGTLGDEASEAALGVALTTSERAVRAAALTAALTIFRADRTRAYMLALPSRWPEVSRPAAAYLGGHGDPATIVARLGGLADDVRQGLREGLVRRQAFPLEAIAGALADADAATRTEAAWLAGAAGASALAPPVIAAVDRAAAGWRAARTLELARGAAGAAAVAREVEAWRAALWAAHRTGAAIEDRALAAASDRAAPAPVRAEAAAWLAAHAGAALRALVDDDARAVRTPAARATAASGGDVTDLARTAAAAVDLSARAPLIAASLTSFGGGEALLVADDTRGAAVAVALTGGPAELIAIARRTGDDAARLVAIAALGRIGGDDARAALEAIVADVGEPATVRAAAWRALARLRRNAKKVWADGVDRERRGTRLAGGSDGESDDGGGESDDGGGESDDDDDDDDDDEDDDGDDDDGDDDDDDDDDEDEDEDEDDDDE
ncbi:MAG: HEAT repeat domain-containing protein [Myxococcales bacterium]|nr:HEAT repeat domain-containing protein [Myxococcales bacterium]